jgi:hypothetical protein
MQRGLRIETVYSVFINESPKGKELRTMQEFLWRKTCLA